MDDLLAAGGPARGRLRELEGSPIAMGGLLDAPEALRFALRMMLDSAEPMCILWGEEHIAFHNDACARLLGSQHLDALGCPAAQGWGALWPQLERRVRGPQRGAGAPLAALVEHEGRSTEAHYAVALARIAGEDGTDGVLCTFFDVTASVVDDRRLALLRAIAARAGGIRSIEAASVRAIEGLASDPYDVPFCAIYLVDSQRRAANLIATCGIAAGHPATPSEVLLAGEAPYPFHAAIDSGELQPVALPRSPADALPLGPWNAPPREAVVAPLGPVGDGRTAVLVAALNPYRAFDEDSRRFMQVVATQVSAGLANAQASDEERRRIEAETLQEIARDLASELDLRRLVQKVTDAGARLTGATFGAFYYNRPGGEAGAFPLFTVSGASREDVEKLCAVNGACVFQPSFLGEAPLRVADLAAEPRFAGAPCHAADAPLPVRSYLAVPVISRSGEVLGGLVFAHREPRRFDERAERSALGLAAQAAVAIDNAHLFEQGRREIGRRNLLERDLREGERRYRELLESLPAAVYTTDSEGRIQLYNEAAVRLWGRVPDLANDRYCGAHRIFSPQGEPMPHDDCPMARVLRGIEAPRPVEVVVERPDGGVSHVIATPTGVRDDGGRIVGAVNMLVDITERKAAEAELAATKDELAAQVESLTKLHELAIALGGMTELLPAMQAILDTAVETQGAQFGLVWLQDPRSGDLIAEASHGFDGEKLMLFSRVPATPSGGSAGNAFAQRRRWIVANTETDRDFLPYREAAREVGFKAVHSTPIVTRSGTLLGVLSVHFPHPHEPSQREQQVADVCARHAADAIEALRSQEALRESERLYRAMGESIDYGVWVCDAEGRNTYVSESFLKLTGLSQDEASGLGWTQVLHPEDAARTTAAWKKCVAEGAHWDVEHRVRGADGEWHSLLARGVPVRNARGAIVAWAGINLDIQRLKQVENELRELDQRKNEFLATLAHELRNPLAPLRNGLEVMRLASGNPQTVEKARSMMERQLAQMVRLVDDLLDVSRVSRGKIELRREQVEIAAVLRNALETSQPLMTARGHEFVADIPKRRVMVDADVTRLSQVFWNLLNNAAKYTEPGGRVELTVRPGEGFVEVSIRDNGVGIPTDMQARVFDIFTQVDRSLEKSQGGLGIGLSIAKRLVEMHGGTIGVKSDGHRKGSEFIVRLPARLEDRESDLGSGNAAGPAPGGPRHRVLVADDNADSASTLSLMLEVLGNEVRVARDGQEAVELAAEFRPDAILLDIGMPRLNGYDACERIRKQPGGAEAFIVALTGWGQDEDKIRSRAAGFDRHLVKPVEPAMLEKMIRALPPSRPASR
ncbi:MAG TPA: GAF domain-containing protein [Usitatibacter sp.]|nr:GAF domain-containing protein [Usitatibacter sp.]